MAGNTQELRSHDAPERHGEVVRDGLIGAGGQDTDASAAESAAEIAGQGVQMRAEAVQRVQIGVVGLALMALLVGLANIIMTSAQQNQAQVVPEAAPTVTARQPKAPVSDPLADMGVVPNLPAEAQPAERARTAQGATSDAPDPTP